MENSNSSAGWTIRLFVLLLFVFVLFLGVVSFYYIVVNTNWDAMDKNMSIMMRLFYVYTVVLGVCLLAALAWLVVDERKINKLATPKNKNTRIVVDFQHNKKSLDYRLHTAAAIWNK